MCVYLLKSHWQAGSVGKGACCQAQGAEHEMVLPQLKGWGTNMTEEVGVMKCVGGGSL